MHGMAPPEIELQFYAEVTVADKTVIINLKIYATPHFLSGRQNESFAFHL